MSDAPMQRTRASRQQLQRSPSKRSRAPRRALRESRADESSFNGENDNESDESISEDEDSSTDFIQPKNADFIQSKNADFQPKNAKRPKLEPVKLESSQPKLSRNNTVSPVKSFLLRSASFKSSETENEIDRNNHEQWIDKYAPKSSQDLCLHPRKLKDVKLAMSDIIERRNEKCRLLVLTGPSGSGKSTTVKILANELIKERKDTMAMGLSAYMNSDSGHSEDSGQENRWVEYLDNIVSQTPQPQHFPEFLQDCKYKVGPSLSVIIIEELPNVFHPETLMKFRQALSEWIYTDESNLLPPLVLCLTELELDDNRREYFNIQNNLTLDTLLGKAFMTSGKYSGKIEHIKFNPVAKTYINKTIRKIVASESRQFSGISKVDTDTFLSKIIESGDIRSIISNLEMWSKLKIVKVNHLQRLTSSSPNSITGETQELAYDHVLNEDEIFMRENQINLFHAIGKIIFSSTKFVEVQNKEQSDYLSVEDVIRNYHKNDLLSLSVLENYHVYNDSNYDVSIASEIVDKLSINDLLGGLEEGREVGFRGARSELRKVNDSRSRRQAIKFPRHFKMLKEYKRTMSEVMDYQRWINEYRNSLQDLNLIDGYYLPLIYNSFSYKLKHGRTRYEYNRLGGRFKQIFADDELPVIDEYDKDDQIRSVDQFQTDIIHRMRQADEFSNRNHHGAKHHDANESDYESQLSEAIEDSDEEAVDTDDDFNDSIDEAKIDLLVSQSQARRSTQSGPAAKVPNSNSISVIDEKSDDDSDFEVSDDPELDLLLSQRKR